MIGISLKHESRGEWDVIHLSGRLDEQAGVTLIRLYSEAGKRCIFNFREVKSINSKGTRAWVLFLRDFQSDREIQVEECVPIIVEQLNMLPSFTYKAKVRSVYVPYECGSCGAIAETLVEEKNFARAKSGELQGPRCKACGTYTELNQEADLFAFYRAA